MLSLCWSENGLRIVHHSHYIPLHRSSCTPASFRVGKNTLSLILFEFSDTSRLALSDLVTSSRVMSGVARNRLRVSVDIVHAHQIVYTWHQYVTIGFMCDMSVTAWVSEYMVLLLNTFWDTWWSPIIYFGLVLKVVWAPSLSLELKLA